MAHGVVHLPDQYFEAKIDSKEAYNQAQIELEKLEFTLPPITLSILLLLNWVCNNPDWYIGLIQQKANGIWFMSWMYIRLQ